jgi:hypothetical protein
MKSQYSRRERDASDPKAGYFLPALFGLACFFFGVNGLGGVFSIRRSTSSSLGLGFVFIARA